MGSDVQEIVNVRRSKVVDSLESVQKDFKFNSEHDQASGASGVEVELW